MANSSSPVVQLTCAGQRVHLRDVVRSVLPCAWLSNLPIVQGQLRHHRYGASYRPEFN
jgi:hypothetical protein